MRELAGEDGAMVDLLDYAAAIEPAARMRPVVALVHGVGQIQRGNSEQSPLGGWVMGGDTVAGALADAIEDPDVEAILFRISSGGGSAVASDTIGRQVRRAVEQGKPVIVSMGDVAASGGYWIAMDASKIVAGAGHAHRLDRRGRGQAGADASSGRTSGVDWGSAQRGANADMWTTTSGLQPARPRQAGSLSRLDLPVVRRGRRARPRPVAGGGAGGRRRAGSGPGAQAKERGLVDELGGFADALAVTRQEIGLAPDAPIELRRFPPPRTLWEQALQLSRSRQTRLSVETWLERLSPGRAQHPADRDSLAEARPA